jgi:hypothetical protein
MQPDSRPQQEPLQDSTGPLGNRKVERALDALPPPFELAGIDRDRPDVLGQAKFEADGTPFLLWATGEWLKLVRGSVSRSGKSMTGAE